MDPRIPQGGLRRTVRLVGLPATHAGRVALGIGRRLGGQPAAAVAAEVQARTAAQLFRTLGELKGGAMKLGQAMSAMEALLPAELAGPYREALTLLQEAAPALPTPVVHQVLAEDLGQGWRDLFRILDDRPAAAASIGQVHRGRWHDGTDVAVKVQYPGAFEALAADLRQLDRVVPLGALGAPGIDLRDLFAELRHRMLDEVDYEQEAVVQRAFAAAFAGDPDIAVPEVVEARPRVLVTRWMQRRPLADVMRTGTADERDRAGLLLLRFFLSAPARVGRIHGDPHPGNFGLLGDGRLGVVDFGSSEEVPGGWPPRLGEVLRAARDRDAGALHAAAVAAGLVRAGGTDAADLLRVVDPWVEPLRADGFRFDRSWVQRHARAWSNPRSLESRVQRRLSVPTRHLLVERVAFGLLGVLTSLGATVPVRAEAEAWMPGLG